MTYVSSENICLIVLLYSGSATTYRQSHLVFTNSISMSYSITWSGPQVIVVVFRPMMRLPHPFDLNLLASIS